MELELPEDPGFWEAVAYLAHLENVPPDEAIRRALLWRRDQLAGDARASAHIKASAQSIEMPSTSSGMRAVRGMTPTRRTHDEQMALIDAMNPATHPPRDATYFRRIVAAVDGVEKAEAELRAAVADARAAGDSWTIIGAALDISRQAAQQRFGDRE